MNIDRRNDRRSFDDQNFPYVDTCSKAQGLHVRVLHSEDACKGHALCLHVGELQRPYQQLFPALSGEKSAHAGALPTVLLEFVADIRGLPDNVAKKLCGIHLEQLREAASCGVCLLKMEECLTSFQDELVWYALIRAQPIDGGIYGVHCLLPALQRHQ